MKCPNCDTQLAEDSTECPYCHNPIYSRINPVYYFLKDNWPFLAIIGLFGTMLTLMPGFFEKVGNGVWLENLGFNGIILLFSTMLVVFFLIILIFLFAFEMVNQKACHGIILFTFLFLVFLWGIIYFIYFTLSNYQILDFLINYVSVFYILPLVIIFALALIWHCIVLWCKYPVSIRDLISNTCMVLSTLIVRIRGHLNRSFINWIISGIVCVISQLRRCLVQFCGVFTINNIENFIEKLRTGVIEHRTPNWAKKLFLFCIIMVGCLAFWLFLTQWYDNHESERAIILVKNFEQQVTIENDATYYNPNIPSSIGIGLTASRINELYPQNLSDYVLTWVSDYGYFVRWIPDEKRVIFLSNNTTTTGVGATEKIFWTYDPQDTKHKKDRVMIFLTVRNTTGYFVANRTLNIT